MFGLLKKSASVRCLAEMLGLIDSPYQKCDFCGVEDAVRFWGGNGYCSDCFASRMLSR